MSRAAWKLPLVNKNFFQLSVDTNWKKINKCKFYFRRNIVIPHTLVDKKLKIYNGKKYRSLLVRTPMIGHKMGEFIITKVTGRKIAQRKLAKLKKKKLKNRK